MEVNEQGYRFFTLHQEDGNVAHIDAHWERFQTQAPILPRQPFGLDFYGKGSSIELLFTTLPRHAAPEQRAAMQRRRTRLPVSVEAPSVGLISNSLRISRTSPEPPSPVPDVVARTINPEFPQSVRHRLPGRLGPRSAAVSTHRSRRRWWRRGRWRWRWSVPLRSEGRALPFRQRPAARDVGVARGASSRGFARSSGSRRAFRIPIIPCARRRGFGSS